MPLFEFRCHACGAKFEDLVRADARPGCPHCGSPDTVKLQSAFAVGRGGPSSARSSAPSCPAPAPGGG